MVDSSSLSRARVVELDKRYVWHPYTPMQRYIEETDPLVIDAALGSRLFDANGRSFIDGNASWWVAVLGHGHPRLTERVVEQAEVLCHTAFGGITHEPAARLAEVLCQVAPPGLSKVFFSDDGSTAVEVALKMSLQYWRQNGKPERRTIVTLEHAFHGETLGASLLSGVSEFSDAVGFASSGAVRTQRVPTDEGNRREAFEVLERLLQERHTEIAAVIVEPLLQGAGGMRIYSADFLRHLRELTRRYDVFLIADEVFTGYGRTGPMWACQHAEVAPDFLCTAKGLTAGVLPMAATLTTERVFQGFLGSDDRALFYGHTYAGHPLGAAVALEVLEIFEEERILEQAQQKAEQLRRGIERVASLAGVSKPRSLGLLGAVNLGERQGYLERAGWRVYEEALRRGAYIRPLGDVVYLAPPLNITEPDLAELLEILFESVRAAGVSEER